MSLRSFLHSFQVYQESDIFPVLISVQSANFPYFQNFKNSKLFKPSRYKKTPKFEPKKFLKINDYEKPTKKEERKKKATFQNPFLLFLSFVLFCLYLKKKKKKKEGVLEACLLFCWFLIIVYFKKFF